LMKHVNEPLPLPGLTEAQVPATFEKVLLKVLSKNPDDRYQTVEEMAQAIRAASEEAGVQLPDRISLPLSFSVAAAAEPISVISGTARENLTNTDFAKDQTDAELGKKMAAANQSDAAPTAAATTTTDQINWGALIKKYGLITLGFFGIIVGANLMFMAAVAFTGDLGIFVYGWPLQVLVVALALAFMLFATRWLWMIMPTSAVLISGLLLSYYWFTGDWSNWTLWMLTGPVVLGSLIVVVVLYFVNRPLASRVAYYSGMILIVLTGTAVFAGTMYLLTNPDLMQSTQFGRMIDQTIQRSIDQGLKNIPNLPDIPALKNILTPTP
jgi:hypothetical protein